MDYTRLIASENCHWYSPDGRPAYEQPLKKPVKNPDGSVRTTTPTTIRHAIPLGLLPSFSKIKDTISNAGLTKWRVGRALGFGDEYGRTGAPQEALAAKWEEFDNIFRERGTFLHAAIEEAITSGVIPDDPVALNAVNKLAELGITTGSGISEGSFADRSMGYGCKLDYYGKLKSSPAIVDFKTCDKSRQPYETECWQLAAQRALCAAQTEIRPDAPCANVYICQHTGDILSIKEWSESDLALGLKKFLAVLECWVILEEYDPRKA